MGDSVEFSGFIALRGKKLRPVAPAFCRGCALRHRGKIIDPVVSMHRTVAAGVTPITSRMRAIPTLFFYTHSIPNPAPGMESASLTAADGLNPLAPGGQGVSNRPYDGESNANSRR